MAGQLLEREVLDHPTWTKPATSTTRANPAGTGSGKVSSLLADSGAAVPVGHRRGPHRHHQRRRRRHPALLRRRQPWHRWPGPADRPGHDPAARTHHPGAADAAHRHAEDRHRRDPRPGRLRQPGLHRRHVHLDPEPAPGQHHHLPAGRAGVVQPGHRAGRRELPTELRRRGGAAPSRSPPTAPSCSSPARSAGQRRRPARPRAARPDAPARRSRASSPTPTARATEVAASNTTVYAGGRFTKVNNVARNSLAAVDATTGAVDPASSTTSPRAWA